MSDSTVVSSLSAINRNFLRYTSSVPSSSLAFFFPPPSFLSFFFFSKPTKQIFSKRSRWQLVKISNHRLAKPIMHALSSVNRFTSVTVRLITTLSDSTIFPHLQAFDFSNKRWRQFLWPRLIFVFDNFFLFFQVLNQ